MLFYDFAKEAFTALCPRWSTLQDESTCFVSTRYSQSVDWFLFWLKALFKTGTLTQDHLDVHCFRPSQGGQFAPETTKLAGEKM